MAWTLVVKLLHQLSVLFRLKEDENLFEMLKNFIEFVLLLFLVAKRLYKR